MQAVILRIPFFTIASIIPWQKIFTNSAMGSLLILWGATLNPVERAEAQTNANSTSSEASEVVDSYYFTSAGAGFVSNQAVIRGLSGACVETDNRDGRLRLGAGVITVVTKGSGATVKLGSLSASIPPNSTVTLENGESAVISANKVDGSVGITDGGSSVANLGNGQTYPQSARMLQTVSASATATKPLFVIGRGAVLATTQDPAIVSLISGKLFCCPNRDIKIKTNLGILAANANAQFLLSAMPGEVRVFNCRGGTMTFNHGSKFRKIPVAEEFSIFDHRPTKEEVLPADGIGRKEITLHDVDGQRVTSATTNFSVVTLLRSPEYLGRWKRRSAFDKRLEARIIKTAAAMAAANPSGEGYYQTPGFRNTTDR